MDKLLYDLGIIETGVSFEELRAMSRLDLRMQALGENNFSSRLGKGQLWDEVRLA